METGKNVEQQKEEKGHKHIYETYRGWGLENTLINGKDYDGCCFYFFIFGDKFHPRT